MKKIPLMAALMAASLGTQADWYLRGTHNDWQADPMQDVGNNTMLADDVVFAVNGEFKFDRYGDWSENYGLNGELDGANIPIDAGTWDIEFYTDTHDYKITASTTGPAAYHLRGTHNGWAEGDLMTQVAGTNQYEACRNFTSGDETGGPRFRTAAGAVTNSRSRTTSTSTAPCTRRAPLLPTSPPDELKLYSPKLGSKKRTLPVSDL
ncbi:hypothetical protein FHS09_003278 [Microbulbifer rhizosphaerae]|uniref:Uncharacterized protein n=1 Tax=Microbulbifer rhizosphaerae TaxID=1562603 RepID=A0A7W4ZBI3_9GAMM|nr:hypothetical protein [Microbulbifer rhizosphaerae]MBB3062429.1 hypothetical protein [Microbulbifer rhizosphaerae]